MTSKQDPTNLGTLPRRWTSSNPFLGGGHKNDTTTSTSTTATASHQQEQEQGEEQKQKQNKNRRRMKNALQIDESWPRLCQIGSNHSQWAWSPSRRRQRNLPAAGGQLQPTLWHQRHHWWRYQQRWEHW